MERFCLAPLLPEVEIVVGNFKNVKNVKELKQNVMDGTMKMSIIKASMIVDVFQVLAAASKAFHHEAEKTLKTRNVFSEILFNLSPSNKISECFKLFGVQDSDTDIVVVALKTDCDSVCSAVQGNAVKLSNFHETCDEDTLKTIFKLNDLELSVSSLVDCIVSQSIAKEVK